MDYVLYYPPYQSAAKAKELLHEEMATVGTVVKREDGKVTILDGWNEVVVPVEDTRKARMMHYFKFWRAQGFYKNLWNYLYITIFFLLFIK